MEQLFLKLLNMSISASWLVLAVLLLRIVFKRAGSRLHCLLWALVAIRLICPFSIESAMSLIPSAETVPMEIMYEEKPSINSGIEIVDSVVNPVVEASFAPNETYSANPLQIYLPVAAFVWATGLCGLLLYAVISYWALRRRTRVLQKLYENVYICDYIDSSFVLGFVRPKIYINSSLETEQIDNVVSHERAHIRRGDNWWKPFAFLILSVYWFNPLMWLAYVLFCRDTEYACDEAVVASMDADGKRKYSEALLASGMRSHRVIACPVAFGEISVKSRVKSVLNYKKAPFWLPLTAVVLAVAAALCFLTDPKEEEVKQLVPDDFQELWHAVLMSEFGEREITEKWKLKLLEDKLSTAKELGANTACPLEMTLTVTKADGEKGEILIASDGCEVFYSNGVYYEYGVNETGSILELFGFKHFWEDRELDEEGRLVRKTGYNWFEPFGITEYAYEGDLLVSFTDRDGSGKLQGYFEYEYDEEGKEVLQRHYLPDDNGELQLRYEMELIYDEQGNYKESLWTYQNSDPSPQQPQGDAAAPGIYSVATSHADELQVMLN